MSVGTLRERTRVDQSSKGWGARLLTWLRRPRRPADEVDLRRDALTRLDEVLCVLEQARGIVADGWVQDRWFAVSARPTTGPAGLFAARPVGPDEVAGACVVGAVAVALQQRNARADLTVDGGPAIDVIWDALQESRGLGGAGVAGRAAPRSLRLIRIRDIARWNDQPERTRHDVLGLFDLAITRVIMTAMREPARV